MTYTTAPEQRVRLNSLSPWQHRKAFTRLDEIPDPIDRQQVAARVRQLLARPANAGRILPA